jgi:hypothetical protein
LSEGGVGSASRPIARKALAKARALPYAIGGM